MLSLSEIYDIYDFIINIYNKLKLIKYEASLIRQITNLLKGSSSCSSEGNLPGGFQFERIPPMKNLCSSSEKAPPLHGVLGDLKFRLDWRLDY